VTTASQRADLAQQKIIDSTEGVREDITELKEMVKALRKRSDGDSENSRATSPIAPGFNVKFTFIRTSLLCTHFLDTQTDTCSVYSQVPFKPIKRTISSLNFEIQAWNGIPSPSRRVNVFKETGHDIIRGFKHAVRSIRRRFNR
jgi:hypothetical protein